MEFWLKPLIPILNNKDGLEFEELVAQRFSERSHGYKCPKYPNHPERALESTILELPRILLILLEIDVKLNDFLQL